MGYWAKMGSIHSGVNQIMCDQVAVVIQHDS